MPKPARKAALLDGAKRVICIVEHAPSQQIMQELANLLKQRVPSHYRFVREDLSRKGGFLLRWHLKATGRKSRAKKPVPVQATTQAKEPVIHIPRGQMRQRTAVLTLPNGQRREATPDLTTTTNAAKHRAWFNETFALDLAEYPDLKPEVKVKVNGHITLEGKLVAPKAIILRPRNVVTHPARIKPPKADEPVEASPGTLARKARRTGYKDKAATRKAQPRKPPAAKARSVYVAPQSRQRNAAAPAMFEWQVVFLILDVARDKDGKKDKREIPNLGFVLAGGVTTPNTSQEKLKSAVKPLLLEHGLRSNRVLAYHPVPGQNPLLLVLLPPTDRPKLNPAEVLDVLDAKRAIPSLPLRDNDELYRFAIEVMYREEMLTRPSQPITYTSGATPPGNNLMHWQVLFCICGTEKGAPLLFHIADEAKTVNNRKESLKAGASLQLQALGIAPQDVLAYRGINGLLLVFIRTQHAKGLQTRSWNQTKADFPALASQHAALQQLADQNVAQATPAIHWQVVFCLCQQDKPPMFTIAQQATTAVANRASYRDAAEPSLQARGLSLADVLAYHPVRGEQNLLLVMLSAHQGNNWQRRTQATASKRLPALDNVRPEDFRRTLAKALERQGQTPPPVTAQSATL